jgi:putative ABC transport system permease protein
VVFQFAAAIVFTLGTLIIYQQIQFIKERPIGYDIANLVEVPIEGNLYGKSDLLREELVKTGAIEDLCVLSNPMVGGWTSTWEVEWPGKQPDDKVSFVQLATAYHFSETYGVNIVEGRDFSEDYASDSSAIMLNEAAVAAMGLANPIGAQGKWQHGYRTVVGVFKDFIKGSPYQPVQPMIVGFAPKRESVIALRLDNSRSISDNLSEIESVFKKYNPAYPFQYSFVDARYEQKFALEKMLGHLSGLFAGLTLFISCLGLLGLTAFTALQRTKEIGIRKVLGASVASVVALLSKDFIKLVLIAILMATPIAWYVMHRWLQSFAYRIELQWWMFASAGLLAMLIALVAVSFQSVNAALVNPVKTLRNE